MQRGDNTVTTQRKTTGIRMPVDLDNKLTEIARKQGFTKNAVMIQALRVFVKKTKKEEG